MTPLPEGWERSARERKDEIPRNEASAVFEISDGTNYGDFLYVGAHADGVRVCGENGWRFDTAESFGAFPSILRRAWRQHEHLKAGAREPLGEAEECAW